MLTLPAACKVTFNTDFSAVVLVGVSEEVTPALAAVKMKAAAIRVRICLMFSGVCALSNRCFTSIVTQTYYGISHLASIYASIFTVKLLFELRIINAPLLIKLE